MGNALAICSTCDHSTIGSPNCTAFLSLYPGYKKKELVSRSGPAIPLPKGERQSTDYAFPFFNPLTTHTNGN